MSHFLFVLVMEYLSRLMKLLCRVPDFKFYPKCKRLSLVQLEFANDLLLFSRGDLTFVTYLFTCFTKFSQASVLSANTEKSSIYFRG